MKGLLALSSALLVILSQPAISQECVTRNRETTRSFANQVSIQVCGLPAGDPLVEKIQEGIEQWNSTSSPLLARRSALGLLVDLGGSRDRETLDRFRVAEAAVRLAEGQPTAALEAVAGPAESLRAAGSLLGSLRAALVATRAELARKRRRAARVALRAGVLESFTDLPDVPAVRSVLARVLDSIPDPAFLDRLDLWLILAEDSPGVEFPD